MKGKQLKLWRQVLEWNLSDVAERAGLTYSAVGHIEHDRRVMRLSRNRVIGVLYEEAARRGIDLDQYQLPEQHSADIAA